MILTVQARVVTHVAHQNSAFPKVDKVLISQLHAVGYKWCIIGGVVCGMIAVIIAVLASGPVTAILDSSLGTPVSSES